MPQADRRGQQQRPSRPAARPPLRSALATFAALGAAPWADQAAAERIATGETARRRDVSALLALTPQEAQVARLLAGGRTTREAAAALFLSPKTVEYPRRHVSLELGIGSRDELTAAIEQDGRTVFLLGCVRAQGERGRAVGPPR